MKKSKVLLTVLAMSMVLGLSIGSAMAYFTTFVTAKGGVTIKLGDHTTIEEPDFDGTSKHIVIHNEGPDACYVRAKAFSGQLVELDYADMSGGLWSPNGTDDGYWYYDFVPDDLNDKDTMGIQPVPGGEDTQELLVHCKFKATTDDVKNGKDKVNVVVIYESAPVIYQDNGKPYPIDHKFKDKDGKEYTIWEKKIDVDKTTEVIEKEGGNS